MFLLARGAVMYAVISCSSLVPSGLELSWLVVASVQATALNGKLISIYASRLISLHV